MIDTAYMIQRRHELGMTQEDVAFEAGTSNDQVCRIECGRANPGLLTLEALCRALKTDPNKLMGWK